MRQIMVKFNLRDEPIDSVEGQRNSAMAERHFGTMSKRNLSPATKIARHNSNKPHFCYFRRKKKSNLLKKPIFINIAIELKQN